MKKQNGDKLWLKLPKNMLKRSSADMSPVHYELYHNIFNHYKYFLVLSFFLTV